MWTVMPLMKLNLVLLSKVIQFFTGCIIGNCLPQAWLCDFRQIFYLVKSHLKNGDDRTTQLLGSL